LGKLRENGAVSRPDAESLMLLAQSLNPHYMPAVVAEWMDHVRRDGDQPPSRNNPTYTGLLGGDRKLATELYAEAFFALRWSGGQCHPDSAATNLGDSSGIETSARRVPARNPHQMFSRWRCWPAMRNHSSGCFDPATQRPMQVLRAGEENASEARNYGGKTSEEFGAELNRLIQGGMNPAQAAQKLQERGLKDFRQGMDTNSKIVYRASDGTLQERPATSAEVEALRKKYSKYLK
jgi:hypothetical protein